MKTFPDNNYFNVVFSLLTFEILGFNGHVMEIEEKVTSLEKQYDQQIKDLLNSGLDKRDMVFALVAWDFPLTWIIYNGQYNKEQGQEFFNQILKKEKVPALKMFQGLFAKAIQSLRFHMDMSYNDFLEIE